MSSELGVLAITFREAPADTRAKLLARDDAEDSPSKALIKGHAHGIVRLATCSRIEWIVSADKADWALALLEAAFVSRGDLSAHTAQRWTHDDALMHIFSVAAGLDSVAEGEAAVSRQVLQCFEAAQTASTIDPLLGRVWKHINKLVHEKRQLLPPRLTFGVEQLVLRRLEDKNAKVAVIGMGQIGRAMVGRLVAAQFAHVSTFGRATKAAFDAAARTSDIVIATSAAPSAWLDLPARDDQPLCIDLGCPAQIGDAPGWRRLPLDTLLSVPEARLTDHERDRIVELISRHGAALGKPGHSELFAVLQAHKTELLQKHLPAVLESIEDPRVARRVQQALQSALHTTFQRVRGGES